MNINEAKHILKDMGFLVESKVELDFVDKIVKLYLDLKEHGYDVDENISNVVKAGGFPVRVNKTLELKKFGKVSVRKLYFAKDSIYITYKLGSTGEIRGASIEYEFDSDEFERVINRARDLDSFIEVDVHNAIYEYLSEYGV